MVRQVSGWWLVPTATLWQQDMRGALSQMPMASCQWIWEPRPELNPVVQLTLFDEAMS